MNRTLYKNGMGDSVKLLVILGAVITLYVSVVVAMFDPELGAALDEFAKAMPELMAMFGMSEAGTDLISFMVSYLYGFFLLLFPMLLSIMTANRLIAKKVEDGTMAYLLSAPVCRTRIVLTQMAVLLTNIVVFIAYATGVGLVSAGLLFPGELDIKAYLMVNVGVLCLHLLIGGICFLSSCIFNDTKYSLAFGAGIPIAGFLIQMIANIGDKFQDVKYATFFTLFDPRGILEQESGAYWGMGILAVAAVICFAVAVIVFQRKDIHV